jgi:hypothetical protein
MKRAAVKSSAIASIGYEGASHTLEVEFSSGTIYQYHQVEAQTYRQFMKAPSKGRFLDAHIRDEYPCSRVR